jgi:hypothetical protein
MAGMEIPDLPITRKNEAHQAPGTHPNRRIHDFLFQVPQRASDIGFFESVWLLPVPDYRPIDIPDTGKVNTYQAMGREDQDRKNSKTHDWNRSLAGLLI